MMLVLEKMSYDSESPTQLNFHLQPIGIVHSCYKEKFGTPRQSGLVTESNAEIIIYPAFQPEYSLEGLEGFSHLWILFWFHKSKQNNFHPKVHPPRLNGKSLGVFATRSPHRPNPIGLSVVKINQINRSSINVTGVDLIEGTPVIDIKPYLTGTEALQDAKSGWTDLSPSETAHITWSPEALAQFNHLYKPQSSNSDSLKVLIENTLALDPRPLVYKGYEDSQKKPYRSEHVVRIHDLDIFFRFTSSHQAEILSCIKVSTEK